MEGQLAVPFHFAAEFLILAVFAGAFLDALRRARTGGGWRAGAQALGFLVLCAAQVAHGARVPGVSDDGATLAVAMRAAGFGFVALGAIAPALAVPAAGAAPMLVLGAGLFQSGPASQLALVCALAAAAASVRGFAAHRRDLDPGSFAFTSAFGSFAAGEVLLAIAPPAGGTMLAASHGVRFAGALLLSRWLAIAIGRSVRLRFVTAFVVALTVLVLVLSAALNAVIAGNLAREELKRVAITADARRAAMSGRQGLDRQNILNLANLAKPGGTPNRGVLSTFACLYPEQDFFLSVLPTGAVSAAVWHYPRDRACNFESLAQYVSRNPAPPLAEGLRLGVAGVRTVQRAASGVASSSLEVLPSHLVSIAAAPIGSPGRVTAVLVAGRLIDASSLEAERVDRTNVLTIAVGEQVAATTHPGGGRAARELFAGAIGERVRRQVEENGETVTTRVRFADASWFTAYVPLRRSNNEVLGVLAVSIPQTAAEASQRELNRLLFLIALAAAAIAATIAWAAGGRVTRPIVALTAAVRAIRRGDLSARAPADADDELGVLGRSFNEMAASLDRSTADLRAAAVTESALRGQLEAIMQSMSDALVATDGAGRITIANRAAEQLTGIDAERMSGRPLGEVLRGSDSSGRSLADGALTDPALSGTLEGASRVPVAITAAPLLEPDGEPGRVIVMRDITAEMQAERMKSEFLSNVSHELRTPLTPIKGYTEILKRKKVSKEKAESFLDGILESTARLERIVEILVDFAAMEAGRLKPRTEPVALRPFVADLVGRWKERGTGKFTVRVGDTVPAVDADPRLLAKSLDELIDNAVKFSPAGARVEVSAEAVRNGSKRPSSVRISVKDHGVGIATEQVPTLFRDFQQLDGSETREFGGLGLGLAYVKRVAGVHGGDVAAESAPGHGSTFSLLLPVAADAPKAAPKSSSKSSPKPRSAAGSKKKKAERT